MVAVTNSPQASETANHAHYRPDIDGLRAIAVLSVVTFHAFPESFPGGFVGVDIFFVISGYLISGILLRQLEAGTFGLGGFYVRRVRRIFPALTVMLGASLAAGWFLLYPEDFAALGRHVAAGAAFISNLVLWGEAGYFDRSAALKPMLHLWSLGIEEQFYLVWPLLLWLAARGSGQHNARRRIITVIGFTLAGSFLLCLWLTFAAREAAFYSPFSRFWELSAGALLAAIRLPYNDRLVNLRSMSGLALIALALVTLSEEQPFPGWRALLPVLGSALLISAGGGALVNRTLLSWRPMVWVGLISYPLYLWHWPLISYLHLQGIESSVGARAAAVASAFVLAAATYLFVEKPLRFGPRAVARAWQLGAAMAALAVVGLVVMANNGFESRFPPSLARYADYEKSYEFRRDARVGTCWLSDRHPASGYARECVDEGSGPLVLLWGDSHAARLYPGVRKAGGNRQRIAQLTRNACPPLFSGVAGYCSRNNTFVLGEVQRLNPDTVVLFARWNHRSPPPAQVTARLAVTLDKLRNAGARHVVVVGPAPEWRPSLPRVLVELAKEHPRSQPPRRTSNGLLTSAAMLDRRMQEMVAGRHGVSYFSPYQALCNDDGCTTWIGNPDDLLTFDYGHFTTAGATRVARDLMASPAWRSRRYAP
jgi:peptidoglycan/LPS O-acetylase OafA/YrhL